MKHTLPLLAALALLSPLSAQVQPSAQAVDLDGNPVAGVGLSLLNGRTTVTDERGEAALPYEIPRYDQPRSRMATPEERLWRYPAQVRAPIFVQPPAGWTVHRIQDPAVRSLDSSTWGRLHFGAEQSAWSASTQLVGTRRNPFPDRFAAFPRPPEQLRVVLTRGEAAPIHGVVESRGAEGLPHVLLVLEHERHGRAWARTDERGRFVTPAALPYGTWRVDLYPGQHLDRGAHHAQLEHEPESSSARLVIDSGPSFTIEVPGAAGRMGRTLRARCIALGDEPRVGSWLPLTPLEGDRFRLSYPFREFEADGPWHLQVATVDGIRVGQAPLGPEPGGTRIELAVRPPLTLEITDQDGQPAACTVTLRPVELEARDPFALGLPSLVGNGHIPSFHPERNGRWEVRIEPYIARLAPKTIVLDVQVEAAQTEAVVLELAER